MFTQTKINEDYLKNDNFIGLINNLYTDFIEPVLSGEKSGDFLADWNVPPSNFGSDTITRCEYDTYKSIKESKNKSTSEDDSVVFQFDDYNKIESVDRNTTSNIAVRDTLNQVVNVLNKVNNSTTLGLSDRPKYYTKYEGHNGFMGWHTNSDNPGDRWYLVYNTDEKSSFFRYIDPKTEEMVTKWEPKGWSLNHFVVGDFNEPLWHCVYTKSNRVSFGIRDIGSILRKHKWKDVTVGHSDTKKREVNVVEKQKSQITDYDEELVKECLNFLIMGVRQGQENSSYELEEARTLMNAIDYISKHFNL